jgi:DNA mismatch repair ATPase MutS
MKAHLMYRDRDLDPQGKSAPNEAALMQDLELATLFEAMALGDNFVLGVVRKAVLSGLYDDVETMLYRQAVLNDCLKNPSVVRDMYTLATDAIEAERKAYWGFLRDHPDTILHRSIEVLQMFVGMLKKLRQIADEHAHQFASEGFTTCFTVLKAELQDEYFVRVEDHLRVLTFRNGALISAELGKGNKGFSYVLRKPRVEKRTWLERLFAEKPPAFTFQIADRDENGFRALADLKNRGINLVANALAQSADHILSFFNMLRTELGFYVGCLNLHGQLAQMGQPACFPVPAGPAEQRHSFQGLYDACLALSMKGRVVGNDVDGDRKQLMIITGANQGGKSTLLRAIGLSQVMMQCGMFVPAESFCSSICDGLFTHYKREEDVTMKSGKLDEELSRMSDIVDSLTSHSMLLFNESFAATNEREGSEIARQIVSALLEKRVRVYFVTHLYEFAHSFYVRRMAGGIFLRAERREDGVRTFKISEGEPLETSYGKDLYGRIFGGVQ